MAGGWRSSQAELCRLTHCFADDIGDAFWPHLRRVQTPREDFAVISGGLPTEKRHFARNLPVFCCRRSLVSPQDVERLYLKLC